MALLAAGMFGCSGTYDRDFPDEYSWISVNGITLCLNLDDVDLDPDQDIYSYGYGHGGSADWQESDSLADVDGDWVCQDFDWNGEGLWRVNYAYESPSQDEDWADIAYWCSNPATRHPFCYEDSHGAWSLGFNSDGTDLSEASQNDLEGTE